MQSKLRIHPSAQAPRRCTAARPGKNRQCADPSPQQSRRYQTVDQMPGYARQTVCKLLDRDYLVGSAQGLQLTEDMLQLLVILDRAHLFD